MFIKLPATLKKSKVVFNVEGWSGNANLMFNNCAVKNPFASGALDTEYKVQTSLPKVSESLENIKKDTSFKAVSPFNGFIGELEPGFLVRLFTNGDGLIVCIPEDHYQILEQSGLGCSYQANSHQLVAYSGDRMIAVIMLIRYNADKFIARAQALKSAVFGKTV